MAWNGGKRGEGGNWETRSKGGVETSRSPRLSIDIEHVILLDIELEETARDLRDTGFELEVGDVLVVGQMKVLPRLGLRDLLAADGLRDLLLLLDDIDDVAESVRIAVPVRAAGVEEDVVDGADALNGPRDDSVLGLLQSADAGLALGCGGPDFDRTLPPGFVGLEVIRVVGHVDR